MAEEKKDVEQALAESLKELVLKMPFEKITIKKITDGAGVIRVTFYNHFQDKYDLLGYIVQKEILEPVGILLGNNMYKEALTLIFANLRKDSAFYEKAVRIEGQNSFEEITEECIYKLLLDLMYIAKPSIFMDLRIIFATVRVLFSPESTEGVASGQTTALVNLEEFRKGEEEE